MTLSVTVPLEFKVDPLVTVREQLVQKVTITGPPLVSIVRVALVVIDLLAVRLYGLPAAFQVVFVVMLAVTSVAYIW